MAKPRTLADLRARHREETVDLLRNALRHNGGHVLPAARELDVPQSSLHRMVRETYPELSALASEQMGRPPDEDDEAELDMDDVDAANARTIRGLR